MKLIVPPVQYCSSIALSVIVRCFALCRQDQMLRPAPPGDGRNLRWRLQAFSTLAPCHSANERRQ
eukprot:2576779-Prymnesium_polylepis.1